MAKAVDDSGLWLPPQRLAGGVNNKEGQSADSDAVFGFPSEFPYEFGVSSPVESVAGSTETESSDEGEDFFAGLTRRLSQATIHESLKHQLTPPVAASDEAEVWKTRGLARSPQSTLSGIGSWSGRSAVSGEGTPNGSSRVPSPSTTPFGDQNDPWEVIYAAAGQDARLKVNGHASPFDPQSNRGLLSLPRANAAAKNPSNTVGNSFSNHAPQVVRVRQDQALKQQCGSFWGRQEAKPNWMVQQQQQQQLPQNRGREVGYESVKYGNRPLTSLPQSAWPPLQLHHQNQQLQYGGSGSRGSVPGGSAPKRGCGGTGVFLPRHYGNPSEPRKKTGCAPVVLPAKVVHALNLNIEDLNATFQPRFSNSFATDYDALLARRNAVLMQQRLIARREEAANYEIRLPQEWSY